MSEVCDPIPLGIGFPLVIEPVHPFAFVQNCQVVIMHDGEDPIPLVGP